MICQIKAKNQRKRKVKIALIIIGTIIAIFIAVEVVLRLIARRERKRFDNLPPDEQRKEQERLYKKHQL